MKIGKLFSLKSGLTRILGVFAVSFLCLQFVNAQTFNFTGAPQMYVVPAGVTSIDIEVIGAQGGNASLNSGVCPGVNMGGPGGSSTGTLAVTPGETLWIYVGGAGGPGNTGGWNGGGLGCSATTCSTGGGASDVRQGGQALTNRVIVAGGGGGAEWAGGCGISSCGGGDAGLMQGCGDACGSTGGQGTQLTGGSAGFNPCGGFATNPTAGQLGQGGIGAGLHAGGGGGGYWGGGGGGCDGHGGGGSGYIGGVTNGTTTACGNDMGDGQVVITAGGGGGPPMCDPPTAICPPDMTVQCEADIVVDANDVVGIPDAANGCVIAGQWVDQPHITGARDCDGTTYEYTYHVVDDQGNIGECIQTWTLENDAPTIAVPPGTTVDCFDDIVVSPGDATVTTSCGEVLDVTVYSPVINGDPNCPGTTYTFTYRIEDQCEREATADRVFTIGGTGALSIIPPAGYSCECIAMANPGNATVTSTCGVDAVVTVTGPVLSNFPLPNCPGSTATYTYTATACGVSVSAQQVITIQNEGPVFDNCPENCLIINCEDEGYEDVIQAWLNSVTATASCGLGVTVTNNYNPNTQGTCINNGTTTVTWTARDVCNRTTQCQSMIIINDTEPPIFLEEAKDELDICNYNTVHEFDAWVANRGGAVAYDCDDNITPNQWSTIPNNPSISCMGQMGATSVTVTFVVRDDCGNKSSTTATFTALMAGGDFVDQGGDAEAANELGFALNQNQPNPFRNETVISFNLPESAAATLTIYDVSGKVVKVVQGDYTEGYNEIQINRSELSGAGLLYYELSTANETAVKKMIIID